MTTCPASWQFCWVAPRRGGHRPLGAGWEGKEKLPPASLYSRYLGQGTLSQNGMHCRGTCVMCLRAQSLPFAYLCRSCVVGYVCERVDSALHSCLPPACSFPSQTPLRGRREEPQGLGTKNVFTTSSFENLCPKSEPRPFLQLSLKGDIH